MKRAQPTAEQVAGIVKKHAGFQPVGHDIVHAHCNTLVFAFGPRDENVVIRFCDGKWWSLNEEKHRKFKREQFGYRILARLANVHIPRVIALDATEQEYPEPYLVLTRVPGTPLSEIWSSLSGEEQMDLFRQVGRLAAEIHALPYDSQEVPPEAMQWGGLRGSIREDLDALHRAGRVSQRAYDNVRRVLDHYCQRLDALEQDTVFLHGDLALRNILVSRANGRWHICSLVDTELSGVGCRYREFWILEPLDLRRLGVPAFRKALLEGYGKRICMEDYRLAYLMAELNPDYLNRHLVDLLGADSFSTDLSWLRLFE